MAAADRSAAQHRLVALLGPAAEDYLRRLADTDRSLARQVRELLSLVREYGPDAVARASAKLMPPALSAPTTLPISCASNNPAGMFSRLCV